VETSDSLPPIHAAGALGPRSCGVPPEEDAPERWLGVVLSHRNAELGVVGHVTRGASPGDCILHAFGGVSGSLEYRVPATAIERLLGVSARAVVDGRLEFAPTRLCVDGTVILEPRDRSTAATAARFWDGDPAGLTGMQAYADDGFLGTVEAAPEYRPGEAAAACLIVVVRPWLRRSRRLRIPARCVLAVNPRAGLLRLSGRRRDLQGLADAAPHD
jgi:hypothetical protein